MIPEPCSNLLWHFAVVCYSSILMLVYAFVLEAVPLHLRDFIESMCKPAIRSEFHAFVLIFFAGWDLAGRAAH